MVIFGVLLFGKLLQGRCWNWINLKLKQRETIDCNDFSFESLSIQSVTNSFFLPPLFLPPTRLCIRAAFYQVFVNEANSNDCSPPPATLIRTHTDCNKCRMIRVFVGNLIKKSESDDVTAHQINEWRWDAAFLQRMKRSTFLRVKTNIPFRFGGESAQERVLCRVTRK